MKRRDFLKQRAVTKKMSERIRTGLYFAALPVVLGVVSWVLVTATIVFGFGGLIGVLAIGAFAAGYWLQGSRGMS